MDNLDNDGAISSGSDNVRYDAETEALAYQLWAFQCGRRVRDVVRLLDDGERSRVPDERTIRRWALERGWADRVRRDIRSIAPDLSEQTLIDLILGRREAVHYLRRVVQASSEPQPILDRANQATTLDGEKVFVRTEFLPNKDAITAAVALMDRGGLSHVGTKADPTSNVTAAGSAEETLELEGLSVPELMALEARTRGRKNGQG